MREAYSNNLWDGARKTLATLWDGHGAIWHGNTPQLSFTEDMWPPFNCFSLTQALTSAGSRDEMVLSSPFDSLELSLYAPVHLHCSTANHLFYCCLRRYIKCFQMYSCQMDCCRFLMVCYVKLFPGYEIHGMEKIPDTGPALIVYYHGAIPIDYYYFLANVIIQKGRTCHSVGDHFLFKIPGLHTTKPTSFIRLSWFHVSL